MSCIAKGCVAPAVAAGLCETHRDVRVAAAKGRILLAKNELEQATKELEELLSDEKRDA